MTKAVKSSDTVVFGFGMKTGFSRRILMYCSVLSGVSVHGVAATAAKSVAHFQFTVHSPYGRWFRYLADLCTSINLLIYHNTYVGFYLLDIAPVIGPSSGPNRGPYPWQVNLSLIMRTRIAQVTNRSLNTRYIIARDVCRLSLKFMALHAILFANDMAEFQL